MEMGLKTVNQQRKISEWAERVSACRSSGLRVKTWCRENGISEQTYCKWLRPLYELAQDQRENKIAEITPQQISKGSIAVTVQLGGVELAIHHGADAATIEAVLRALNHAERFHLRREGVHLLWVHRPPAGHRWPVRAGAAGI